jgi:DNA polymerase elongation subunit (family B)
MLLYKYTQKNATRYSLKYIAEKVWGETKPHTTQPVSSLTKEQLNERNLWDVQITHKIDENFFLSQLAIIIAQKAHLFPDTIMGVKPNDRQGLRVTLTPTLDALFLERAHQCGYVLPCKQHYARPPYKGAIITTYKPGIYKSVIQLDFSSLYPNIMLGFGLAPYGKTEVFHPIIKEFLSKKDVAKSEGEYWAMKVLANSVYGIFASEYARIRAYEVAAKITEKEREILTSIFSLLSSMGYDVLLSDTDSFFIPVKDKMEYKLIQDTINQFVATYFNTPNIKVKFKGFWEIFGLPKSAIGEQVKKRYFGRLTFDENLNPCNEIIIVGLEAIRNDWCRLAQDVQKQIIEMKINNASDEEIQTYINAVKQNLYSGKYFNELILTNSLSKSLDSYGGVKRDEKTQKIRKIQMPRHVKALKEALEKNWVPHDLILYNYVEYFIVKNNKPKLAHITKPEEIDYNYYWYRQICPLLFRLGVINEIPRYKGNKTTSIANQSTLF